MDVTQLAMHQHPSAEDRTVTVVQFVEDDKAVRRPATTDCLLTARTLQLPDAHANAARDIDVDSASTPSITAVLDGLSTESLHMFANQPLDELGLSRFVTTHLVHEGEEDTTLLEVPFDVAEHPDAQGLN